MTINATAMWLLALYQVVAEEQARVGSPAAAVTLAGTTQNDIIKEYLSRGTYVFPPAPSLRLITDMIAYTVAEIPKWNPINICSYHLQEAGATPVQELAYALCTAIAVLDAVRDSGQVPAGALRRGRRAGSRSSSTPACGSSRRCARCAPSSQLWDEITRERYGVTDAKQRRFRYGVQVNSLGLTEAQPENNVQRIVLEMLAVTLSKDARARAVQLPAWNEALGLPRPWDQQWSLRMQQVLAFESDLLEYDDLFDGSTVVEAKVAELVEGARAEIDRVAGDGRRGRGRRVRLHEERAGRLARARGAGGSSPARTSSSGSTASRPPSPTRCTADLDAAIQARRPGGRGGRRRRGPSLAWRSATRRGRRSRGSALARLRRRRGDRHQPDGGDPGRAPGPALTTGEWAGALREVFGEFRAPTGVSGAVGVGAGSEALADVRAMVAAHRRGARRAAAAARRQARARRPLQRRRAGRRARPRRRVRGDLPGHPADARADRRRPPSPRTCTCVGLSILSGSHMELVPEVLDGLREAGAGDVPVVVGGIIPEADAVRLKALGVAAVFTPKDFGLTEIMVRIVEVIRASRGLDADAATPAHA